MICLDVRKWLLFQCRYWPVCIGLQYTLTVRVLLGPQATRMFRKGMEPSSLGSSVVNWM